MSDETGLSGLPDPENVIGDFYEQTISTYP